MAVILGKDIETDELITLSDTERFSGLYILGKTGTGKSSLLVSLALQDIQDINEERGLLFIDPHGDAIDDILKRMPKEQKKRVILLDPTDKDYAFGINPLRCADPQDRKERAQAFAQTKDVFLKLEALFGGSDERLGKLLSKYLQYILYPLIENPDSTLYDIKMMLTNKPFRERLLNNMKYNADEARDFWHYQFDVLSRHDQYEELKSTLNRISLFDDEFIRDIISQPKPTIDFADIMDNKKIVLLKIPTSGLDEQGQSFIGALFISQLLKTVFLRADTPEEERTPFAIYCDEFQNFATPDFAKFFAQTRKFKIMPVVAHQYRDFKPGDPIKSATLAVPNKIHFNLTKDDAGEFAIEIAKKPPTGRRRERELVISQYPVEDLLQGHVNPEIRQFVNRYLRPMQERREDIKEEMEGGKLYRMGLQDEAATYQLEAQIERGKGRFPDYLAMERALTSAKEPIARSFYETAILQELHARSRNLKQTTRGFNYFLTAVMEGRITPRSESFADFLIERMRDLPLISKEHAKVIDLYIQLLYGDPKTPRAIPFFFAQAHGLFRSEVALLTESADKRTKQERQEFKERYIKEMWERYNSSYADKYWADNRVSILNFCRDDDNARWVETALYGLTPGRHYLYGLSEDTKARLVEDIAKKYGMDIHDWSFEMFFWERLTWEDRRNLQRKIIDNIDAVLSEKRREKEKEERERIERDCAEGIAKIYHAPPNALSSRVLKDTEIEELEKACLNQFDLNAKATLMVIDDFVKFCMLLSKPENHIKKPSGQYVEKEVPLRTVADMVNETRGELTNLPLYTAYAKITQAEKGNQRVAKIKTFKLREVGQSVILASIQQEILNQTYQEYYQKREKIEEKIRERQRAWQKVSGEKPIPGRQGDIKPERTVKEEESPLLPTRRR